MHNGYNGEYCRFKWHSLSINNGFRVLVMSSQLIKDLHGGALKTVSYVSLKKFIESDKSIGVIHNFDFLFFYEERLK